MKRSCEGEILSQMTCRNEIHVNTHDQVWHESYRLAKFFLILVGRQGKGHRPWLTKMSCQGKQCTNARHHPEPDDRVGDRNHRFLSVLVLHSQACGGRLFIREHSQDLSSLEARRAFGAN